MIETQTTKIDNDTYQLTPLPAHPHGMSVYYELHGLLLPVLGSFEKGLQDISGALGAVITKPEFRSILKTMLGAGLRCNNVEIKDFEQHLYDTGRLHQLYQLALFAVKVNYGSVFQELIGKVLRLANQMENDGEFMTQLTSILPVLSSSDQAQELSKS